MTADVATVVAIVVLVAVVVVVVVLVCVANKNTGISTAHMTTTPTMAKMAYKGALLLTGMSSPSAPINL